MCDLTQFVISSVAVRISAPTVVELSTVDIVLTFGTCPVFVVDNSISFKGAFIDICKVFKIHYWCLSRVNHKGNSMERYIRFLNKTKEITGNDRGTHSIFARNTKVLQNDRNIATINETDISRIMAAVGRDFRFPLNVDLLSTLTLNDIDNEKLFLYLRDVSIYLTFALSIIKISKRDTNIINNNIN